MGKALTAEYDQKSRTLRLSEPLDGFDDHAFVRIVVDDPKPKQRSWRDLKGSLSKEAGESLAEAIDEMFPMGDVEAPRR